MIVGRLIPAGTGLAYHAERKERLDKRNAPETTLENIEIDDVEIPIAGSDSEAAEGTTGT